MSKKRKTMGTIMFLGFSGLVVAIAATLIKKRIAKKAAKRDTYDTRNYKSWKK